eukprot:CAMPEP_0201525726 /NCGR_PEP_ID=MMETSP0161_2-20130828/29257_1 /ASSEMBLY_ACC=CAM_ASM_000251 /TAXON_ID=180227 /ORGANISM="Neoparamoeba aestuarina, Strain SoJaBio B1-5/56/2" /LENGTH=214 /DNA_ID=CAMNT_0047925793 /DNA_START=33 /DNA_END=674 /DNA_ORIENTATION=+
MFRWVLLFVLVRILGAETEKKTEEVEISCGLLAVELFLAFGSVIMVGLVVWDKITCDKCDYCLPGSSGLKKAATKELDECKHKLCDDCCQAEAMPACQCYEPLVKRMERGELKDDEEKFVKLVLKQRKEGEIKDGVFCGKCHGVIEKDEISHVIVFKCPKCDAKTYYILMKHDGILVHLSSPQLQTLGEKGNDKQAVDEKGNAWEGGFGSGGIE